MFGVLLTTASFTQVSRSRADTFARTGIEVGAGPNGVALAELDQDGHLDLLVGSDEGSDQVELFLGVRLSGTSPGESGQFRSAPGAKMIATGDFNNTGVGDAAFASYLSPELYLLFVGRDGMLADTLQAGMHPWGPAAGDLKEDGADDLEVEDHTSSQAAVFLSQEE